MRKHHVNPEEALQIHKDILSRKTVAIHWGTFILTDEPLDEPPRRLASALQQTNIPAQDFLVPRHGETIILDWLGFPNPATAGLRTRLHP